MNKFINLKQSNMSVRGYAFKFTKLPNYIPFMVSDLRARITKFVVSVLDLVSKKCKMVMLIKKRWISRGL